MTVITNISVDLLRPSIYPKVNAVKDDVCTRDVVISLYSGGVSWPVPEDVSAAVGYRKPDGTVGLYDTLPDGSSAVSISGNVVTLTLAAQMLTAVGAVEAAVTLAEKSGNQITTFAFDVIVSANPGSGAIKSEDYFNYVNPKIQAVIEQAAAATTAANTAASRANASAELAEDAYDLADTANQKVDTLREVVSKLHSNIVETASGEVIQLSDASDLELAGLRIFGKTEQFTTTGKNLLNLKNYYMSNLNGLTVSLSDDVLILNGTATAIVDITVVSANINGDTFAAINNLAGETVCVSNNLGLTGYFYDGTNYASNKTTVPASSIKTVFVRIPSGSSYNNAKLYVQIEKGSVATTYEPYTGGIPSPNPDYPQPLESVGGSVTTTVCGKNLLPIENHDVTVQNIHWIVKDGAYTAVGTANEINNSVITVILTNSGYKAGTYYISGGTTNIRVRISFDDGSGYKTCVSGQSVYMEDFDKYLSVIAQIYVPKGFTVNETAYPMITLFPDDTYEAPKEPTTATVTPVDSSGNALYLPGIKVESGGNYTDENGQQWICDEVDFEKGVYVQRVAANVLDGTENWLYNSAILNGTGQNFYCVPSEKWNDHDSTISNDTRILSTAFTGGSYRTAINAIAIDKNYLNISVSAEKFPNVSALKEALAASPVGFQYILAKENNIPLSEIDPDALAQYAALHTNYPNTTIYNDAGADMKVKYVADTKLYIDKKFDELAAALVNNV